MTVRDDDVVVDERFAVTQEVSNDRKRQATKINNRFFTVWLLII
jgi:hypothetical protein